MLVVRQETRYEPIVLAIFAVIFWFANAAILLYLSYYFSVAGWEGSSLGAVGPAAGLIFVGIVEIILIVAYAMDPTMDRGVGTATIVMSLFSLLLGGGLLIGSVFGVLAGSFWILLSPSEASEVLGERPRQDQSDGWVPSPVPGTTDASAPPTGSATSPGITRICLACEHPNPVTAAQCESCGRPMPPLPADQTR
ncbi:MAG TPA: zinc ribbon domain-containing protein [Thermoplasmata archaeon]|nr:zinc ribbon domain-containing protein [Thermoplasmata archaeon]